MYAVLKLPKQVIHFKNAFNAYLHLRRSRDRININELRCFLTENLKMDERRVDFMISNKKHLSRFLRTSTRTLQENYEILRAHDINVEDLQSLRILLSCKSTVLHHRILLLQELAVPVVTMSMIQSLAHLMQLPLDKFVTQCQISSKEDLIESILQHANPSPDDIPLCKGIEPLRLTLGKEDVKVVTLYEECLNHIRLWKLNLSLYSKKHRCYKYLSLRILKKVADEMQLLGLDPDQIRRHEYLLNKRPGDIQYALNTLKDTLICGMSIREFIKFYPKLLHFDPQEVKEMVNVLKEYKVSDDNIRICPDIFTLSKEKFIERVAEYNAIPELKIWRNHKRFAYLLYHFTAVKKRLKLMNEKSISKWINIHIYTVDKRYFSRYVDGMRIINAARNIIFIVNDELGLDGRSCMQKLRFHSHYQHIPIYNIWRTIKYLKQHYSKEDIFQNIHIILYDRLQIQNVLKCNREEFSTESGFTFNASQELALCLYVIEKAHNFSGNGVWSKKDECNDPLDKDDEEEAINNENLYVKLLTEINS